MKIFLLFIFSTMSFCSFGNESESNLGIELLVSIRESNLEKFEELLKLGVDPNYRDENGEPSQRPVVLELAAVHRDPNYLKLALKYGGNPNTLDGYESKTILFEASKHSRLSNVKILVVAGARLDELDDSEGTALHTAIAVKNFDIAHYLIMAGASLTHKNKWGYTPLDMLRKYGNAGVKKYSEQYQWYLKVVQITGIENV
ncbi:ankyrin repeat domain-containing protein [uncultured Shewanella sp.]|uniref:ankyrin repeat domain-containing protein n=1 Tax=Shewanella atlantica TaxID=271099 RepID=UPI00262B5F57|nr:ankyrin repeat domain-containing protein [uncultured Shewanella sp.]